MKTDRDRWAEVEYRPHNVSCLLLLLHQPRCCPPKMSLTLQTLTPLRRPAALAPSAPPPPRLPLPRRLRLRPAGVKIEAAEGVNRIRCDAEKLVGNGALVKERSVSVLLLAGGKGKRMGASMPKQYLPLLGQPIALYSFYGLSRMLEVKEIVVVCDPSYRDIFQDAGKKIQVNLKFAIPGKERQDSVFNGFQEVDKSSELVCIHDSARPLVSCEDIAKVLKDGLWSGAAVLGVPVKATIKEANCDSFVVKTLERKTLWEMQTPQVIKPELLRLGFDLVNREGLEVTDDVSIVEHLKHPVYITEGSYTNIKVTTPDDMILAERILIMEAEARSQSYKLPMLPSDLERTHVHTSITAIEFGPACN